MKNIEPILWEQSYIVDNWPNFIEVTGTDNMKFSVNVRCIEFVLNFNGQSGLSIAGTQGTVHIKESYEELCRLLKINK